MEFGLLRLNDLLSGYQMRILVVSIDVIYALKNSSRCFHDKSQQVFPCQLVPYILKKASENN